MRWASAPRRRRAASGRCWRCWCAAGRRGRVQRTREWRDEHVLFESSCEHWPVGSPRRADAGHRLLGREGPHRRGAVALLPSPSGTATRSRRRSPPGAGGRADPPADRRLLANARPLPGPRTAAPWCQRVPPGGRASGCPGERRRRHCGQPPVQRGSARPPAPGGRTAPGRVASSTGDGIVPQRLGGAALAASTVASISRTWTADGMLAGGFEQHVLVAAIPASLHRPRARTANQQRPACPEAARRTSRGDRPSAMRNPAASHTPAQQQALGQAPSQRHEDRADTR